MNQDKYAYFHERQALTDRLASLSWQMARIWKEYERYKGMQDAVLKRLTELDREEDYGITEQQYLGNEQPRTHRDDAEPLEDS